MVSRLVACAIVALFVAAFTASAQAAVVQYTGTITVGFGDGGPSQAGNPDLANNGLPPCAKANPYAPAITATLPLNGIVKQSVGGNLDFAPYGRGNATSGMNIAGGTGGNGGMNPRDTATCRVPFPPFINPRLRLRTQIGGANWPATTLNGGTSNLSAAAGAGAGSLVYPIPFPGFTGLGAEVISAGANTFGGILPRAGTGAVNLGLNTVTATVQGHVLQPPQAFGGTGPPQGDFGLVNYFSGLLPTGPSAMGTVANTTMGVGNYLSATADFTMHTPGGPNGTPGVTVSVPVTIGVTANGAPIIQIFPVKDKAALEGVFFEFTTGFAQHSDQVGDFFTTLNASGFDCAIAACTANQGGGTSAPNGTTRKLQLVTPWGAGIRSLPPAPDLFDPQLGFGGMAVVLLKIAPEPGSTALLAVGIAGLFGVHRVSRRRS